jgi:hypothetical protein
MHDSVRKIIDLLNRGLLTEESGQQMLNKVIEEFIKPVPVSAKESQQEKLFLQEAEVKRNGVWYNDFHRLEHLMKAAEAEPITNLMDVMVQRAKSGTLTPMDAIMVSLLLSDEKTRKFYLYLLLNAEPDKLLKYHNMYVARKMFPEEASFGEWGRRAYNLNCPLFFAFSELRAKNHEMLNAVVSGAGYYPKDVPHWTSGRSKISGGEPQTVATDHHQPGGLEARIPIAKISQIFGGEIPMPVYQGSDGQYYVDGQAAKDYVDRTRAEVFSYLSHVLPQAQSGDRKQHQQRRGNGGNGGRGSGSHYNGRGRANYGKGVRGGADCDTVPAAANPKSNDKDFQ